MHDIMGSSPEVLSWTSCPSLLVGKLKEELKLSVVGDAIKKSNSPNSHPQPPQVPSNLPPQIITDLAPPTHLPVPLQTPGQDEESMLGGISPLNTALSVDSTRSEGQHFENSVLQLQEQDQDEAGSPASCEHGGCGSGLEEQMGEGDCSMDHSEEGKQGHHHQPEDIKLHFHRAGPGSGGFLEGLFGCLRPVLNIIGKTYSTEYKLQQQGAPQETYFKCQSEWREEVKKHFEKIKSEGTCIHRLDEELIRRRRDELRHALDIREHYERKLERANNLYMELSAIMLQLEVREKELMKREQAVEKKYPGTYKRHLVRPIVRTNAVEKLIKKKGSLPHKPGMPTAKRPDLLRSDGIPSVDPLPSPSLLTASPKVSTPPGKARYRSKTRHRRANSKGSHSEFAGVLKPVAGALEGPQSLKDHHHHLPTQGPFLPLKGREEAVVNCANNLRYFGPAAALRSPQTDHMQGRVSGSGPDLISTAVSADTRQQTSSASSNPVPGSASLCPCCQTHPFPGCLKCQETSPAFERADLPYNSQLPTEDGTLRLGSTNDDPASGGEATKRPESEEQEAHQQTLPLPTPLPRTLRPLRKGGDESSEEEEGEVDSEVEFPRRQRPHRCMSSFQSCSTFSSENLSVSDGEEGNTSDHSHSGPLEGLSASQEEHLDELLSHTPDIPIDISTQSDGLSDKECAVRRVKTQISLGKLCSDEHSYENPLQFGDSDCDSSEAECSDATIRNNKVGAPSTW
ncbi:Mitogen-activated protein kinase kinase kinase 13 [Takifugu flavidus]|uniref:mitogen-activated protein kinase kinase kinase n=1 Tax=Takifugu flavidus TaxID=433684 RepID=A0A5C6PR15_9TELE|nr:Mitogen-activated protein kinase kinase kinase 13 [Takifugu flavidus]